ncbi:MAG: dienelactone hydrolase family protein, partial [Acidimicrobiia bacterium]
ADAFGMVQSFDWDQAGPDMTATMAHLLAMPGCTGSIGGAGFCFGGTLAYLFAATCRVDGRGPDAAVSYYGSGVHTMLNLMDQVECPLLFHYGARDPFIPEDQIALVEEAAAGRPDVTLYRYDAGHAFSNWDAPSMYDKEAADQAWERTLEFLARYLAGRPPG